MAMYKERLRRLQTNARFSRIVLMILNVLMYNFAGGNTRILQFVRRKLDPCRGIA